MTEPYTRQDAPENVRELPVASDPELSTEEKELRMVTANDQDRMVVSTEIPTFVKWLQSIRGSTFEWVRLDAEGSIVAAKATVPKGNVKLQATARKSNQHSQMVSYGEEREQ